MTTQEIEQSIRTALAHHQAGQLPQAEAIYRQVLMENPVHADALHWLGLLAHQAGRRDFAIDLISRAIAIQPNRAEMHNNLGNVLCENGQVPQAVAAFKRAIQLKPAYADAFYNLANALKLQGKPGDAIAAYQKSIQLRPENSQAHNNLGNVFYETGRLDEALASYSQAIACAPNSAEAHNNIGNVLRDQGKPREAIVAFQKALAIDQQYAVAHNNLGNPLQDLGEHERALAAYSHAIALRPDYPQAHNNLGTALRDLGRVHEAIAACARAIALDPNYADAHWNYAQSLLLVGDFARGWPEFEWRTKCKTAVPVRTLPRPRWDGGDLSGKTILLQSEQGFGDTIQFVRYAPLVASRGARVVLECNRRLHALLQGAPGVDAVIAETEPVDGIDFHFPLLSLPLFFTSGDRPVWDCLPYLSPGSELREIWRRKIESSAGRMKIGLVWAGNPRHGNDRNRSIPTAQLAPLAAVDAEFYSLQIGPAAAQLAWAASNVRLIDHTHELHDFAQTAALIANLDLVISVDTAVAHLAGAMGKTVWLLLPFSPDWRWMLHRPDSPWYPTMRLFRQKMPGDWKTVVQEVCSAMQELPGNVIFRTSSDLLKNESGQ